jgi:hypothetical protein
MLDLVGLAEVPAADLVIFDNVKRSGIGAGQV